MFRTIVLLGILLCLCFVLANGETPYGSRDFVDSLSVTDSLVAHLASETPGTASDQVLSANPIVLPKRPNIVTSFLHNEGAIWSSPFKMDWDDAAWLGGIAATTAILIATDEPVYRSFRDYGNDHTWVRKVSPVASQLGEFYVPYGIAALFCLKGVAFDDTDALDTGLLSVQAMVHSGILVQVLKHVFSRSRPFVKNGNDNWYGPRKFFKRYSDGGFSPYDSFPSGHTITAFSIATVIAERSDQFWVGAVSYSLAGLCGLSRLTEHDHWMSDVVVGAAMGVAIGKLVVRTHERGISVVPMIGSRSVGVSLQLKY